MDLNSREPAGYDESSMILLSKWISSRLKEPPLTFFALTRDIALWDSNHSNPCIDHGTLQNRRRINYPGDCEPWKLPRER